MANDYRQIISILQETQDLLLVGHEAPDCDCLCAIFALWQAFGGANKHWTMVKTGEAAQNLHFLPGMTEWVAPDAIDFSAYNSILLVDCGDLRRPGAWLPERAAGKRLFCIDHHATNAFAGEYAIVEPDAAAACEIVAAILEAAELRPDDETALCLYAGIVGDTGCFRYSNTTQRAFLTAAKLLPQVDTELLRIHLFEDRSWPNYQMVGLCFRNLRTECAGRLAYSFLNQAARLAAGAGMKDCDEVVNYTLELSGVKLGVLFVEDAESVKLSFRCRSGLRVDQVARLFGGGGHAKAAGCTIAGTLAEVMPHVLEEVRKLLAEG